MSSEKKNKGRPSEAIENDSPTSRLVQKFLEMIEVDYVRNAVIPALEAEGFERIDFHHGTTEVGKDLIFSKDEGFGKKALVVAVVKPDRLSKSSSDTSGLPVVLVQVDQAKRNEVVSWDGTKKRPDKVLVIFADDPSHDLISANPGGFQDRNADGVKFILGSDIATSLLKHRRDIAEQILESKLDTSVFLEKNPTNLPLLHALHGNQLVNLQSIFTDLDAAVGSTTILHAMSLRPSGISDISIPKSEWLSVSAAIREMENNIGTILNEPLDAVENKYIETHKKTNSPENKAIWDGLAETIESIKNWIAALCQDIDERKIAIDYAYKLFPTDKSLAGAIKISTDLLSGSALVLKAARNIQKNTQVSDRTLALCTELDNYFSTVENSLGQLNKLIDGINENARTQFIDLVKTCERELKNTRDFASSSKKKISAAKQYVPPATYKVVFDLPKLSKQMKAGLESFVNRFKSEEISTNKDYSRNLLEDVRRYLTVIDSFVSNTELAPVLKSEQIASDTANILSACILGLLNSGADVLVTGNAGSGKSTTLEMFTRQSSANQAKNDQIIFLPLAKLANVDTATWINNPLEHFYSEVTKLFRSTQPGITSKSVKEQIEHSHRLVLVLDGIDEALNLIGWLSKLIEELRKLKQNNIQIVASSRFGGQELEKIGLIRIHLLPFRREQVIRFVNNFLRNEPNLADEVIQHLNSHPTMFSVAQTPLMSTILCVLAQNGVVLPETINALYKERFELLWGAYDAKKQVHRVKSSKACLEDVSKKSAYYLHNRRIRSSAREEILESVYDALSRKYKQEVIRIAFEELEIPCNVFVKELDGTIGFDHLSYQEYLVSDELYTNRSSELVAHLTDPWWRGVLVLAAMKAEDIGSIIEQRIMETGSIGAAADTLKAMIEVTSTSQKKILSGLLRDQKSLDNMVASYNEDNFDDYL